MTVVVFDVLAHLLLRRRTHPAQHHPCTRLAQKLQHPPGQARSPIAAPGRQVHLIAITLLPPWKEAR
ncbi:hypothetical protein ACH4OW_14760 [Streptomyces sp. NPDC017056]|uniref:hypothetical protein n=1 Tax=Streptomyces sp. NPDC017056 TaxID=3364973 RepID=UPI0037AA3650